MAEQKSDHDAASASAEPDADLIAKLESLKASNDESDLLGFYAVMAVMSMAPRLADSIRLGTQEGKTNDAFALVNRQVLEFTKQVGPLLEHASLSSDTPAGKQLISMAKAAMKVPFEYLSGTDLSGTGMTPHLSNSLMRWGQTISGADKKASQSQLEDTLRRFIDARIKPE